MPHMQAFVGRLNTRFNGTNIDNVDESLLGPMATVGEAATQSTHGGGAIQASQAERDYVTNNFSANDLEELRKVLLWAVQERPRVPVQFLWVPSDDGQFHVKIWNVEGLPATAEMPESQGGVSVLLSGPTTAQYTQYPPPQAGE